MLVVTKKHHTDKQKIILRFVYEGDIYNVPKSAIDKYKSEKPIPADEVFAELDKKYTKAGVLLKGVRCREGLNQIEFAKKIKVTQSDLSKMEQGKRPIGKIIAKRIEKAFVVNYRYFLE